MSNSPSLIKQLTGALIGGTLGLIAYYGYEAAAPRLTAWTSIPQQWLESNGEGSALADKSQAQDRTGAHHEARAKEISEKFGAAYKNYQVEEEMPAEEDTTIFEDDVMEADTGVTAEDPLVPTVTEDIPAPSWVDAGERGTWDDAAIEKAHGPDTDELPDSGIGVLGALFAAGAGAGGLRMRKKKVS
jgi:hypothetical protein